MVCCKDCKHFLDDHLEDVYDGVCYFGPWPDFLEKWQIETGDCECYEHLDSNDSKE